MVGVVTGDYSRTSEARLQKFQHMEVKSLGAIEQNQINLVRKVGFQRFQRITHTKLHPFLKSSGRDVTFRSLSLFRFKLGGDDLAFPVVADCRC